MDKELRNWGYAFTSPRDFFEFYNKKLKMYQKEMDSQLELIDKYKLLSERNLLDEKVISQKDETIHNLQMENAKLIMALEKERRKSLQLEGDCNSTEATCDEFYTKYNALLIMSGKSDDDVNGFILDHSGTLPTLDNICYIQGEIKQKRRILKTGLSLTPPKVLENQIKVMEKRIVDLQNHSKEEIAVLREELNIILKDRSNETEILEIRIKDLLLKYQESQDLLYLSLNESMGLKKQHLIREAEWLKEKENLTKLARKCDVDFSECIQTTNDNAHKNEDSPATIKRLKRELAGLENKLINTENLLEEYKLRSLQLENTLARATEREEFQLKMTKELSAKLKERNELLKKQLEGEEKRRKMEKLGFQEEFRLIKQAIKDIESKKLIQDREKERARSKEDKKCGTQRSQSESAPRVVNQKYLCKNHYKLLIKPVKPPKQATGSEKSDRLGEKPSSVQTKLPQTDRLLSRKPGIRPGQK